MAQDGSSTPRRALEPLPDEPDGATRGGRFAAEDAEATPRRLRRLAESPASPVSPVDPLDVPGHTPVPPPAPVLPEPAASLPPGAGRRFSASAEPSEFTPAAPRRSAVSPASPDPALEAILPPAPRPSAAPSAPTASFTPLSRPAAGPAMVPPVDAPGATIPDVADDTAAVPVTAEEPTGAPARKRSARPAVLVIAAVLVVSLLVAAVVWLLTLRSGAVGTAPGSTPSAVQALDPLVTSADLGTLGGLAWTETTSTSDPERPVCVPATGADLPAAARTVTRKTPAEGGTASLVQTVDTYADDAAATAAYDVRLAQLGTCGDAQVWITGGNAVTGLADDAAAVRLVAQEEPEVFHTVVLSRTGRAVSVADAATPGAVNALDLANVVSSALGRQCSGLGTCPSGVHVESAPPPAGEPAGWLVEADLPRITAGTGRWAAVEVSSTLQVSGSLCEAMNLAAVSGPTTAAQRTLLLADDPDAPQGFGVDMVTYTYTDAKDAAGLAKKLTKNLASCADRAPTATVKEGPDVRGTGDAGTKLTGSTFSITQKTETATVVYRVAVVTAGSDVVYLLGNPTPGFDFTDGQWKAVATRAGVRATQA